MHLDSNLDQPEIAFNRLKTAGAKGLLDWAGPSARSHHRPPRHGSRFGERIPGPEDLDHRGPHHVKVRAEIDQDARGDAATLTDDGEQQVLGADVVVTELQRLPKTAFKNLLGLWGERK